MIMLKEISNKEWKIGGRNLLGVQWGSDINDYVDSYCGIRVEDVEKFNNGEDVPMYVAVENGCDVRDYAECFGVVEVDVRTKFLNISNHIMNEEQVEGVKKMLGEDTVIVELPYDLKGLWSNLTPENYQKVVTKIKLFMYENGIFNAHLAGFMPAVYELLGWEDERRIFFYAFSERESVEEEKDGIVVKKSVFKHRGWYRY